MQYLLFLILLQWIIVACVFIDDTQKRKDYKQFKTRRELHLNIIPFYWLYKTITFVVKSLKDGYRELP